MLSLIKFFSVMMYVEAGVVLCLAFTIGLENALLWAMVIGFSHTLCGIALNWASEDKMFPLAVEYEHFLADADKAFVAGKTRLQP